MTTDTGKITIAADDLGDKLTKGGSAAKTLGTEIANAINALDASITALDSRVSAIEAGGGDATPPTAPTSTDGLIENFTAASPGRFTVDGMEVANANANKTYSLIKVDDYTLQFECRQGDHWSTSGWSDPPTSNRCECEFTTHYPAGQQLTITEKITIMPGPVSTAGFVTLNQLHTEIDNPPCPVTLQIEQNTDKFQVVIQSPTINWNRIWLAPQPLQRGKEYDFKVVMTMGGNGKVDCWLDGEQICNYRGSVGASSGGYFWKWGNYRDNVPQALIVRHKNMHLVASMP